MQAAVGFDSLVQERSEGAAEEKIYQGGHQAAVTFQEGGNPEVGMGGGQVGKEEHLVEILA
jgi:hypothetical protein